MHNVPLNILLFQESSYPGKRI